jgi:hypothetical protein
LSKEQIIIKKTNKDMKLPQDIALRDFEQALTINVTGPNTKEKIEEKK